jgi:hypothetical protein
MYSIELNNKIVTLEKKNKALEQQIELLIHRHGLLMNFITERDIKIMHLEMESVEKLIKKNELDT